MKYRNSIPDKTIAATAIVVIPILLIIAYRNIVTHEFLRWDDLDYIVNNTILHYWSLSNLKEMFIGKIVFNWHPLTWLSYTFNFTVFGHVPLAFKITNLLIHLVNAYMIYILVRKLYESVKVNGQYSAVDAFKEKQIIVSAVFASLFFAIHPQHVESVVWISGRKDILCTFFYLLAIVFYLNQCIYQPGKVWASLTAVAFILALMSKSMAVTLPAILITIDIFILRRLRNTESWIEKLKILLKNKISLIIIAGCVSYITIITQGAQIQSYSDVTFVSRIINYSQSVLHYLFSIIYPFELYPYYPFSNLSISPSIVSILPVALLLVLVVCTLVLYKYNIKVPLYALLSFFVALLPVSGILHVGQFAAADRYAYLPTVGLYILLGISVSSLIFRPVQKKAYTALLYSSVLFIVIGMVSVTNTYSSTWKNDKTLWLPVTEKYPGKVLVAYQNIGNWYLDNGRYDKAIESYSQALKIDDGNADIYENLGKCYERMGDADSTLNMFNRVVELAPQSNKGYILLGDFYYNRKLMNKADYYYGVAIQLNPNSIDALVRNAAMDYYRGDIESASIKLGRLFAQVPDDIGGLQLAALIYLKKDDIKNAKLTAQRILKYKPDNAVANKILE